MNTNFLGHPSSAQPQSRWMWYHLAQKWTCAKWSLRSLQNWWRHVIFVKKKWRPSWISGASVEKPSIRMKSRDTQQTIHLNKCLVFLSFQQKRQLSPGCLFGSKNNPLKISWWITTGVLGILGTPDTFSVKPTLRAATTMGASEELPRGSHFSSPWGFPVFSQPNVTFVACFAPKKAWADLVICWRINGDFHHYCFFL